MIREHKRAATAIAVAIATLATALVAQPAQAAVAHSSNGATRVTAMTVSRDYVGMNTLSTTTDVSMTVPSTLTTMTMKTEVTVPNDLAGGDWSGLTFKYEINPVVPAGVTIVAGTPTQAGQIQVGAYSNDPSVLTVNSTAKTFTVQGMGDVDPTITFTFVSSASATKAPYAGTYSMAPVIKTSAGATVALAQKDADIPSAPYVSAKSFSYLTDTIAPVPAGASAKVTVDTCANFSGALGTNPTVNAALSVDGADASFTSGTDKWFTRPISSGVALTNSLSLLGSVRAHAVVTVDNSAGVAEKTPNIDLAIYGDAFPGTSGDYSLPCAPAAPAKPTLSFNSAGVAAFVVATPSPAAENIATSYEATLLDATTHMPVAKASVLKSGMTANSSTLTANSMTFKALDGTTNFTVAQNVNYTLKLRAKYTNGTAEVFQSLESPESSAAMWFKPVTPSKPTVTAVTGKSVTATFPATTAGDTYLAGLWKTSDTGFANTIYGTSTCTVASSTVTCVIPALPGTTFLKPDAYVVRAQGRDPVRLVNSDWSLASNSFEGVSAGVYVPTPDASWSRGGKATVAGSANAPISTSNSNVKIVSDGLGSIYYTATGAASAGNFPITMTKMKFDGTMDSTFGTSGSVSFTVPATQNASSVGLFAGGKYGYASRSGSPASGGFMGMGSPSTLAWTWREGTLGSAPGAPITITTKLKDVCNSSWSKPMGSTITDAYLSNLISAPTTRPIAVVTCADNGMTPKKYDILAKVASDGSLTNIWTLNEPTTNGIGYATNSISVNPNATAGTDVTIVVSSQTETRSGGVVTGRTQKLLRVDIDGNGYDATVATPFTQSLMLAPFNNGQYVPALLGTPESSMVNTNYEILQPAFKTDLKVTKLNSVQIGTDFATPVAITWDTASPFTSASSVSFPFNANSTRSDGSILVTRSENVSGAEYTAASAMNVQGSFKTGQIVNYERNGDSFELRWLNGDQSKWMYVPPVAAPATPTSSTLTWSLVALVNEALPSYTMKDVDFVLNAGAPLTITGTNFTLTSTTKNVKGVKFGASGTLITPSTKTATSLKVQIPVNTAAASVSAPKQVDVFIVLGDNTTVPAGSIRYIGNTKAKQTVAGFMTITQALTTDPDSQYGATVTNNLTGGSNLAQTVTASPATVCSMTPSFKVHFEGMGGICSIKNVVASNAYMDGATDTWTITVRATDTITAQTTNGYDGARGFVPVVSTASGRGYTLAIASGSATTCETPTTNSATKLVGTVYLKSSRPLSATTCDVIVTTPASSTTWTQETKTVSIAILPPAGESLAKAISVTSTNSGSAATPWRDTRLLWNATTGNFTVGVLSTFVGPITATLKFKDTSNVSQSCVVTFGTQAAVPAAQVSALKLHQSAGLCTGATLTKLKARATANGAAGTPVTLDIVFKKYDPALYTLKSTDTYPTLYLTLK